MTGPEALAGGLHELGLAVAASRKAPLSARHALHAAVALDQMADLAHAGRAGLRVHPLAEAGDVLAFRALLRAADPALGPLMDLVTCGPHSPRLQVVAAEVAPEGFARLAVEELMVSLYNAGQVPRLMLIEAGGRSWPMQDLLPRAAAWWAAALGPAG